MDIVEDFIRTVFIPTGSVIFLSPTSVSIISRKNDSINYTFILCICTQPFVFSKTFLTVTAYGFFRSEELIALQENIDSGAVSVPTKAKEPAPEKVEMLTIKECTEVVQGFSEHTVRQLVAQGKVKSVHTGEGKREKVLVNKAYLIAYFQKQIRRLEPV